MEARQQKGKSQVQKLQRVSEIFFFLLTHTTKSSGRLYCVGVEERGEGRSVSTYYIFTPANKIVCKQQSELVVHGGGLCFTSLASLLVLYGDISIYDTEMVHGGGLCFTSLTSLLVLYGDISIYDTEVVHGGGLCSHHWPVYWCCMGTSPSMILKWCMVGDCVSHH